MAETEKFPNTKYHKLRLEKYECTKKSQLCIAASVVAGLAAATVLVVVFSMGSKTTCTDQTDLIDGEIIQDPNSLSSPNLVKTSHIHLDLDIDFNKTILTGYVIISLVKTSPKINTTILDAKDLVIYNIVDVPSGNDLIYDYVKDEDKLEVSLPPGKDVQLKIHYSTSSNASALSWLSPGQTADKEHPFVYSLCETIHCRTMLPCQDTPSVKFPYSANITAPAQITVLMSATEIREPDSLKNGKRKFFLRQNIPIPSYLISLAAGAVESRKIGPRSRVWSEKKFIEKAVFDFSEVETMLLEAEKLSGPYVWGNYDILIMPPSFPYGGMENPGLTFASTTTLSGDKSNAWVIVHEIAHSWTGNLVTNANWEHFWINEGFTTFVEEKISEQIYGESTRDLSGLDRRTILKNTVDDLGADNPFTALVVNLTGKHADDMYSKVPYCKGSIFLWYLESLVGVENMESFLRCYYQTFQYKSISSDTFKEYFTCYFSSDPSIEEINWDTWLYGPGMPIYEPPYNTSNAEESWDLAARWQKWDPQGKVPGTNASTFQNFSVRQKRIFLNKLQEGEALDVGTLEKMEEIYKIYDNPNVAIKTIWIRVGLKARWDKSVPEALKLVTETGRMTVIVPVYSDLYAWEEKRELAVKTFSKNEESMMITSIRRIRKVLHLD